MLESDGIKIALLSLVEKMKKAIESEKNPKKGVWEIELEESEKALLLSLFKNYEPGYVGRCLRRAFRNVYRTEFPEIFQPLLKPEKLELHKIYYEEQPASPQVECLPNTDRIEEMIAELSTAT